MIRLEASAYLVRPSAIDVLPGSSATFLFGAPPRVGMRRRRRLWDEALCFANVHSQFQQENFSRT